MYTRLPGLLHLHRLAPAGNSQRRCLLARPGSHIDNGQSTVETPRDCFMGSPSVMQVVLDKVGVGWMADYASLEGGTEKTQFC